MRNKARRLPFRFRHAPVRRAGQAVCLWLGLLGGTVASAATSVCVSADGDHIRKVCYETVAGAPVYGHGILGDTPEWNALVVHWGAGADQATTRFSRPNHIFEDVAPRLVDVDADGVVEIIVVESSFSQGARVLVLDTNTELSELGATPFIGQRNRWFAPIGAADLDGDGAIEIAYIDRPHLAKRLRVWRLHPSGLRHVADAEGLTNHRIGDTDIPGGIRTCAGSSELITANANWTRLMATRLGKGGLTSRDVGAYVGRESFQNALACEN